MSQSPPVVRLSVLAASLLAAAASAQAAERPGWYSTTDLSFVLSTGNTRTGTLGIKTDLTRQWLRTSWETSASFIRTDVGEPTRRAVGTDPATAQLENGPRVTKAEKLFIDSEFRRRVTERFYWNVGGTGERDIFAGLKSRGTGVVGVGYMWENRTNATFSTGIGATYTVQRDVVDDQDPETENEFAGIRFTADGERRFGERSEHVFNSQLIVDENVQNTDDLRFNWANALAVSLTRNQRLALQVGVDLKFDNQPQLVEFPLFFSRDPIIEDPLKRKVVRGAEKLDTTFTVSLVINFSPGGPVSRVP